MQPRVALLLQRFRAIDAGPMRDLPIRHDGLPVEVIGFEPDAADLNWALGVLLTPWCMNLVRLPLQHGLSTLQTLPVGHVARRPIGDGEIAFIGAHDDDIGGYETCSLFSPMQGFADADSARATAREVLAQLRRPVAPPVAVQKPVASSRRGFLFGLRGA